VDQNWRDSKNVAAAEPQSTDAGQETKKLAAEDSRNQPKTNPVKDMMPR
jgi:hypothetical protein